MPKPIVALARRYQRDAITISTLGVERGHGDIAYHAIVVAPSDIENAVVNLLRFHEPDTAILFCATRDAVRHLHANLIERGFNAVALSGEHSQSERNHALQALRDRRARVCVATDVAARGLDLPSLSLVIHVELPRDVEALHHRSGRTGRAGKKGIAALIIPFQRRRRVEAMLRTAKVPAEWLPVPSPAAIRDADRERLLAALSSPVELDEEDRALGARLLEQRGADDVAAMLVRAHRSRLPAPEELVDLAEARARPDHSEGPRPGFEDTVWFRVGIGRRQNADPRWILPLLCRRGHITKQDVGAIRITADETLFEVPRATAARFAAALRRTAPADPEGDVPIEQVQDGRNGSARPPRGPAPPRHQAKPFRPAGPPRGRR
jgi:ATP-dependent RNA helicase DeaD